MSDDAPDKPADAVETPAPEEHAPTPEGEKKKPLRQRWPFGYMLLWVLMTLSLLFNVIVVSQVIRARNAAQQAVSDAVAVIADLQTKSFSYTIVVDKMLPVDTDIPIDETIPVTIDQTLDINTIVTVPVDAGILGVIELEVPIDAEIPVYFEQDIVIDQPFHLVAAIPVYFEVPINLSVVDTPFYDTLDDVRLRLMGLSETLGQPLVPVPGSP